MNKYDLILSIDGFLGLIDPLHTIDRQKAMIEISSVVMAKAVEAAKKGLVDTEVIEFNKFLEDKSNVEIDKIIEYFRKINKLEILTKSIDDSTNEVRINYIKTHLEALNEEKRQEIFNKFPALVKI